ncbi:hypothetical protein evm_008723 [Chilo suppressalis]|nr:hypothetical protein evm_008723 [Chilo suppressalis]
MSPYFYLLCLSIVIKYSFCYDYILERDNLKYKYGHRSLQKRSHRQKSRPQTKHNVVESRPEYEEADGKEPIAQIDVDSFIRKPDEYAVEENSPYETETKKSKYKTYQDYGSPLFKIDLSEDAGMNDNQMYLNPGADDKISKFNANPLLFDDSINPQYAKFKAMPEHRWEQKKIARNLEAKLSINNRNRPYGLSSIGPGLRHNLQKKSSSKYLKLPFFFRSKNETQKLKKNKKRKILCFNCLKKDNKSIQSSTDTNTTVKDIAKKGFEEKESTKSTSNKKIVDNSFHLLEFRREKRDDWAEDKERQLKEIEEIQKKIDDVEIRSIGNKEG